MFIQTEETPNPNALKFYPEKEISSEPIHFASPIDAKGSKLVLKLFGIEGVSAVFFGSNFITITKNESLSWDILKPYIIACLMDHFGSNLEALDGYNNEDSSINYENLSEIEKQIVEIIETRVRPSVAMDGGDIIYRGFEEGIVYLQLKGSCSGCPSSTVTLKNGIETMLQYYVPEVISVEAIEE